MTDQPQDHTGLDEAAQSDHDAVTGDVAGRDGGPQDADDMRAADGLSDGRAEGLGPPPSPAKAVAATEADSAAVAAPRATVLRVMSSPPSRLPSPEAQPGNRQKG